MNRVLPKRQLPAPTAGGAYVPPGPRQLFPDEIVRRNGDLRPTRHLDLRPLSTRIADFLGRTFGESPRGFAALVGFLLPVSAAGKQLAKLRQAWREACPAVRQHFLTEIAQQEAA